jgi:hypothetical protein
LDAGSPTDLPALLVGSSFTWAGPNVNFQAEVSFIPTDAAHYGPLGSTTPCPRAIPGNDLLCWTVLKWNPALTSSTWHVSDLSADTAAGTSHEGWRNTQQVGIYAKPGPTTGNTLSEYLGQMSSHTVLSFGVALGSGAPAGSQGWVKNLTFGGTSYDFAHEKLATPVAPTVTRTADLNTQIANGTITGVAGTTSSFVPSSESVGNPLTSLDPTKPFSGALPWADASDSFVDVYAYSSPVFIGTFRVVGGKVLMSGLDLSALRLGGHHLVFQGQTSGTISAMAITVAVELLAATGPTAATTGLLAAGGALLLLAGLFAVIGSRRRTAHRRG